MIFLNKESDKKVRIKVRLSEEENEKLERCSALCGLSQSALIRQLCKGNAILFSITQGFMNTDTVKC